MLDPQQIREGFPYGEFGPPASRERIAAAEALLGHTLPTILRNLYLAFDGFLGPTNAKFFYSLDQLEETNGFLRSGEFPDFLSHHLAVGDPGTGSYWLMRNDGTGNVQEWDAEWGDDTEARSESLLEVWLEKKREYDSFDDA